MFDMDADPWQMDNIYSAMKAHDPATVSALHDEVQTWLKCKGPTCKPQ